MITIAALFGVALGLTIVSVVVGLTWPKRIRFIESREAKLRKEMTDWIFNGTKPQWAIDGGYKLVRVKVKKPRSKEHE